MTSQDYAIITELKNLKSRVNALENKNQVSRLAAMGVTVFDEQGIVSTGAFNSYSVTNLSAGLSTSSTSYVDVPGSTLPTLNFTRDTRVMFVLMGDGYNNAVFTNASSFPYAEVVFHDTVTGDRFTNVAMRASGFTTMSWDGTYVNAWSYWIGDQLMSRSNILTIPAGNHTYHLQYRAVTAGTAYLFAWTIGIVVLGT